VDGVTSPQQVLADLQHRTDHNPKLRRCWKP
jgi:hypothetical protein